jgi:D-alanyl-D-alanine dipeptidase
MRIFKYVSALIMVNLLIDTNAAQVRDLTDISTLDSTILLDIRYATENNFLGIALYESSTCYLRTSTAIRLIRVQKSLREKGLGIKIYDGYRPLDVQKRMWEKVPDPRYVSNPEKGSNHNRGCAVDVTLVDQDGYELKMPTDFDHFSEKSHLDYMDLPQEIINNRDLLQLEMEKAGFIPIRTEWWHFNDPDCRYYDVLNIPFSKLSEQ